MCFLNNLICRIFLSSTDHIMPLKLDLYKVLFGVLKSRNEVKDISPLASAAASIQNPDQYREQYII